jgi:hypothetical protein
MYASMFRYVPTFVNSQAAEEVVCVHGIMLMENGVRSSG